MPTNSRILVTHRGQLPGPPQEGHHCIFADFTGDGTEHFIRTMVLSARPELKGQAYLDFEITDVGDKGAFKVITASATNTTIPLDLVSTDLQFASDRLPADHGATFRIWLSKGFGK